MKKILTLSLLVFTFSSVQADVSPEHVADMLSQMVRENVISKEEAEKAKSRLGAMTPEQWKKVNEQAANYAARTPASANPQSSNKIESVQGVDLDGEQFRQIQNDMRKIAPSYND